MIYQIYKILRITFFTLFVCISFYSIKLYEGSTSHLYCLLLIININAFLFNQIKDASYFEIFFAAYFFLGFWFKYVFSLLLYDGIVYDSQY